MEGKPCQVLTFWEALYVRGLARQFLCLLGSLEDVDQTLEGPCGAVRLFLADAVELMEPEAATLLRDNGRPLTDALRRARGGSL